MGVSSSRMHQIDRENLAAVWADIASLRAELDVDDPQPPPQRVAPVLAREDELLMEEEDSPL